ncbi:hypothetical protein DM860_009288 [Cuscuta australis]|uniref:Glycosyltransferase n=1 Tax=Cuscuta australis TaxID=267555 RepID=A0A328DEX4_9ASTE|nr:hypothetical protein DM860_009288 [Cuscuta australis]
MDAETEHMKKTRQSSGGAVHVVMVPAPLQGHLTPFVHLALKLASHGFTVTFLNTHATHSKLIRSAPASAAGNNSSDIFSDARDRSGLDIRYAVISDGFPPGSDQGINEDMFIHGLIHVFSAHVDDFIGSLRQNSDVNPPVSCLLADSFFVWPSAVARKHGLVNVSFWTQSALAFTMYFHKELLSAHGHLGPQDNNGEDEVIDYIPGVEAIKTRDIPSHLQDSEPWTLMNTYVFKSLQDAIKADIIVSNTVFELESSAIAALQRKKLFYPVGPVFRDSVPRKTAVPTSFRPESADCRPWLDARPENSVLYVSFGSLASVDKHAIREIARGLALSGASFLWAIRGDITGSSADEPDLFPAGFGREVEGRGLVVPWCNQTEVLSHRATGGFLTHCGWNSVLESVWWEVPMLCFPLFTDQPANRRLVVDDWKVGINLCDGKAVEREEVRGKANRLMSRGATRERLGKKVKLAKEKLQRAANGSTEKHLEAFMHELKLKAQQKHSVSVWYTELMELNWK